MMNQYLSDKIKLLSLLLIVLVLYIHSGFNNVQGFYWNSFIQDLISNKIGRLAVPLFFMISGYLFYLKTENGLSKIKKRFRTIILPYIYGCTSFVLIYAGILCLTGSSNYMNFDILTLFDESIFNILKKVYWMQTGRDSPLAFHLWFLRDLIIIIILSPLIYFMIKKVKWIGIFLLFITILFNVKIYPISLLSSIGWFAIGGWISINKNQIVFKKVKWGFLIFIAYLFATYLEDVLPEIYFKYIDELLIMVGSIGIWYLYDTFISSQFSLKKHPLITLICEFTFFIYLVHEPLINIIRKLIVLFIGKTSSGYLVSYICSPIFFLVLAVLVGKIFRKTIPKIYSNFVGGRI